MYFVRLFSDCQIYLITEVQKFVRFHLLKEDFLLSVAPVAPRSELTN